MLRAIDKWLPGYLRSMFRRPRGVEGLRHLIFCVADHFEPFRGGVSPARARADVRAWVEQYARMTARFRDADGRTPQHTFFYPRETYDRECVELLAGVCGRDLAEVEMHLHHRDDTEQGLSRKLEGFRDTLRGEHGLLGGDSRDRPCYGFVHGNWALCNSRPDGDWCGVNRELTVLCGTRCFADFTFPSAPSPTQPRTVNALYYARDRGDRPRSHDRGQRAAVGAGPVESDADDRGRQLLLVTGPLCLDWGRRKWGLAPRLENSEISEVNPATPHRIGLWTRQRIHVQGRPDWVFVKVHTHGCVPGNRHTVLGRRMEAAHQLLTAQYNDGRAWALHYVTAREMFNLVRAAEAGCEGNPGDYRDFALSPPPLRRH